MEFLHECMVNKFKKTSIRKQQTNNQTEAVNIIEKDVMEGKLTNSFRNLHIYFIYHNLFHCK